MRYIVAVSGGVDSVVLLDMLVKSGEDELIVAHFDHGIRPDSAEDARFVEAVAKQYNLPFFSRREELGSNASEELARKRRYVFLRELAKAHRAKIVTAHHGDDVVETVAINIVRGTGWRGLAVLGAEDVERPLLHITKQDIYTYALKNRLEWVEDSTNASDAYLRNRIRKVTARLSVPTKRQLLSLRVKQTRLRQEVRHELEALAPTQNSLPRYFFIMLPEKVALEVLREVILRETGKKLLDGQLTRGIGAVKTARAGTQIPLGNGVELRFKTTCFIARVGVK